MGRQYKLLVRKFKFKLDPILKYRQILKDIQQSKFVKAQQSCEETENYVNSLDLRQERVYQSMIESAEQGFSLVAHQGKEIFNRMITEEKSKEKVRLAKRKKALDFERIRFTKAAQDYKALEKVKDKAKELHQKELLSLEMKQIDDLVNSRFGVEK
jgi:flagellar export protein FliJ